ncbi:MAG TPA: hypothetical protein VLI90_02185 [Tepidisphaeraceae bacterium]|nr:hypothetical protein [Tepidisphaeraceae bacterium]
MQSIRVMLDRVIETLQLSRRNSRQRRARRTRAWERLFGLGAAVG